MRAGEPIAWPRSGTLAGSLLIALVFCLPASAGASEPMSGRTEAGDREAVRSHAERLAQDATRAFDRFLLGEDPGKPNPGPMIVPDSPAHDRSPRSIESGSDWLARAPLGYDALIERLAQPTAPNPVVDAARKLAAERDAFLKGENRKAMVIQVAPGVEAAPADSSATDLEGRREGAPARSANEPRTGNDVVDPGILRWLNRGYRAFQDEVVGKLAEPPNGVGTRAEAANGATIQQLSQNSVPPASRNDARHDEVIRNAETERKAAAEAAVKAAREAKEKRKAAEAARIAKAEAAEAARQIEMARRAEEERKAAEAVLIAKAKAAEEARQIEIARKAEEERKPAETARIAEMARKTEEARKDAEAARIPEIEATVAPGRLSGITPTIDAPPRKRVRKARRDRAGTEHRRGLAPVDRPSPVSRPGA